MTDPTSDLDAGRSTPPSLEVTDATATMGGSTIWTEVSITVWPGDFVAVLGPNGAGKSTLLKAILGLIPLKSGRISVLGCSPQEARREI